MSSHMRWLALVAAIVFVFVAGAPRHASAQAEVQNNFKYNSGQDIQPNFEGWSKSADGSFFMHFGYMNRNYVEEPTITVGPNNSIEPGGPDRGQPTFFYARTNRNLFKVSVPKDFGKKELIWTLTVNGKTEKAYGWLQPEWEIDPAGGASTGGRTDKEFLSNKPPTIALEAASSVAVGETLTLNATVIDDGIPKPAPQRKPALGQETPPTLVGDADAPVNVPSVATPARGAGGGRGGAQGPTVTWIVWRGPAGATFAQKTTPVKDTKAQTTVAFTKPGEYIIRGRATDRILTADKDIKITVK